MGIVNVGNMSEKPQSMRKEIVMSWSLPERLTNALCVTSGTISLTLGIMTLLATYIIDLTIETYFL